MDIAVVADFDGTVTEGAVCLQLLDRFAAPEWQEVERQLVEGSISVKDCTAREFGMLEATEEEIKAFVREHAELREGFPEFVSHLRGLGYPLAIASNGVDIYIDEVLETNGIDYVAVFCNTMEPEGEGRWSVGTPHEDDECDECGTCKANLVEMLKTDGNYVVYIGNGRNDLCPAKAANLVFARDRLAKAMMEEGLPFIGFEDFFDIMEAWDSVVAHG